MKHIRNTLCLTACLTALTLSFSFPARAADPVTPAKKRAPAVREAKRKPSSDARSADMTYASQTGRVVYQILLAEIALQRGEANFASQAYADLALRTRDPKVLERTIEVASFAQRFDLALEAARLWAEEEPSSKKAQQMMAGVMIMSNQLDDLAPQLVRMLETDKEALAENLLGLNRMFARNSDRPAVFRLVEKVCLPFFGIAEAHYAVAIAASLAGENDRALAETRRALELRPDWEMAALLQGRLLLRDAPAEAVFFLQGFLERNPNARDVQLTLARALVGEKRYADARQHYDQLLLIYPNNPDVVYPVAILALQQNDVALAETQFKHLLTLNIPDKSLAYYYLGQIAEDSQHSGEALAYYALVGAGEQYLPAQLRRARILVDLGQLDSARTQLREAKAATPDDRVRLTIAEAALLRDAKQTQEAFDLLEKLLSSQPEQPDLLYETALLAEKLGRFELLETRLRKVITLRPDSAPAYNALGYSYADRNIRLSESKELIEKALKLSPDDGYILDSMGWLLYRQGDYPGALNYLERAYAKRADPEVAAHMGEVLWVMGRKDDARRILSEAEAKFPGNDALADAIKQLVP